MRRAIARLLQHVRPFLRRHRRLFFLGILALLGTDAMHLLIPWFTRLALDGLTAARDHGWGLLRYPALIVLAAVGQGVFRFFWRTNVFGFSRNIEWDLRNALFAHLQRLPLSYFQHTKTGDLMSRLTNDLASVREMLGIGAVAALDGALLILAALPLMIGIDPWLTLWSLLSLPGITLLVLGFGNRIHRGYREVQQFLGRVSIFVQENLAGIRVVQAHAQEENQLRRFTDLSAEYMRKNLVTARLSGLLWPLMAVFSGLAAAIVLWLGGRRVLTGQLTIGQFVQFNGYLAMLTWPVMAIGYVVNLYQRGSSALARLVEILETPVAPGYLTREDGRPRRLRGEIEFRGLSFRYGPEGRWVLRDVSLTIPAGSRCAIVGEVGAGKSTFVNLIPRLFEAPEGTLFLDGRDIRTIPLSTLKASIGLVSQDIFLFSETIRENILFGRQDATIEDLEEAARVAALLPSIQEFADRFETLLGERGVRLSGGQKQRTALARALIKNPPILILDDAFSSVDVQTEERILSELKAAMEGRTTILISHRISTLKDADQIVYLKDGCIAERGTHQELLAREGHYHRLYQKQLLASELEALAERENG
ncbi:MAG: ABC transporter ATP-binding protein [candidate division NC10 bacterium]|nr:ABC transporter ATP-binding protein [candidate division NC10 bacterium]